MPDRFLVRLKRILTGVAVGLAISVATILIMEGAASDLLFVRDYRAAVPPKSLIRPHTTHDTLLGWVNRPSFSSPNEYGTGITLTTTALGFRSNGFSDNARATEREGLVCSGDSYTLGYGVSDEHAWCAVLSHSVSELQTFNMGQSDYGLDQTFLWYRRDGRRANARFQLLGITNGQLERLTTATTNGRFKPVLALEKSGLVTKSVPVPVQTSEALRSAAASHAKDDLRMVQLLRRIPGLDGRLKDATRIDGQWSLVENVLDALVAVNEQRASRLLLAYLPTKRDIKPSYIDERRKRLAEYSRRRGIPFVDLTQAMRVLRRDSLDLMFISRVPRDAASGVANQYSDLGNAWIARMLAAHLVAAAVLASR